MGKLFFSLLSSRGCQKQGGIPSPLHTRELVPARPRTPMHTHLPTWGHPCHCACSHVRRHLFLKRKLQYLTGGGWLSNSCPPVRVGKGREKVDEGIQTQPRYAQPWALEESAETSLLEKFLCSLLNSKKKLIKSFFLLLKRYRQVPARSRLSSLIILCHQFFRALGAQTE